jgi:hypothetical protein
MFSVYEVLIELAIEIEQKDEVGIEISEKMLDLQ